MSVSLLLKLEPDASTTGCTRTTTCRPVENQLRQSSLNFTAVFTIDCIDCNYIMSHNKVQPCSKLLHRSHISSSNSVQSLCVNSTFTVLYCCFLLAKEKTLTLVKTQYSSQNVIFLCLQKILKFVTTSPGSRVKYSYRVGKCDLLSSTLTNRLKTFLDNIWQHHLEVIHSFATVILLYSV